MEELTELTAYKVGDYPFGLKKPSKKRDWMDEYDYNFPYRCLPLSMANTLGWDITLPFSFEAEWVDADNGRTNIACYTKGEEAYEWFKTGVWRKFGKGKLTFITDLIFQTSDYYNLIVTGPLNEVKNNIQPLTGVVETDWGHSSFTMTWQFTEKNRRVKFNEGDSIARIIPYHRKMLEDVQPKIKHISENPTLEKEFQEFQKSRTEFNENYNDPKDWQKHYFQGKTFTEEVKQCPYHQIQNKHKEFKEEEEDEDKTES